MNILFLHRNFPAQFKNLATYFAHDPQNKVFFITAGKDNNIQGVNKIIYAPKRVPAPETHRYLKFYEESIIHGQDVANIALQLKKQGFVPDVIIAHNWGQSLFIKDVFPNSPLICHFEWFYNAHGADTDFNPAAPINTDTEAKIRVKNSHILVELYSSDHGISPTQWQKSQFPKEYQNKIDVVHEGVDTQYFVPNPEQKMVIPEINLDLSKEKEIITYVGRGMEPYRGFPEFMKSIEIIQKRRPNTHFVIVGQDRVCYGAKLPDGKTFKQVMLETLDLDMSRIHFTGHLSYDKYIKVLQASSAHVYLTYPFVLSWSALEAMSTGCIVIGSKTAPVEEVIKDGENGLLVDFYSPEQIADKVDYIFKNPKIIKKIKERARKTIVERYDVRNEVQKQVDIVNKVVLDHRAKNLIEIPLT